jgi:hypothetical protein
MSSDVNMCVLRSLSEIEQIRPVWESWPGNPESDLDFYVNIVKSSRETVRPHILVASRDGRPDAVLVGRFDRRRIPLRLGYLRFIVTANVLFFVGGPLRGNESIENCRLFIQEIRASLSRGEADAAYFHHLPIESYLYSLVRKTPGFVTRDHVRETQPHFSRRIPESVEEFHRSLSPYFKRKQKANKLVKDFPDGVTVRCYSDVSELDKMIHDAEHVARKSYQRGLGVGFADSLEERERLTLKAQKGWMRSYILYLGEQPVAFWIGDMRSTTFGSDYLGHDPDFGKYSPGLYLILKVMEDLCSRVAEVDFAPGKAEYKQGLSDRQWEEASIYIFAPSLQGIKLNLTRLCTVGVHIAAKRVLESTGFLSRIKKAWRARLNPAK